MTLGLKILNQDYFNDHKTQLKVDVESAFATLKNQPLSLDDFKFYLANAAVHSSNIEGNTISFDTYLNDYSVYVDPTIPHFSGQSDPPISRCVRVK